jgi:hypothetical protein
VVLIALVLMALVLAAFIRQPSHVLERSRDLTSGGRIRGVGAAWELTG